MNGQHHLLSACLVSVAVLGACGDETTETVTSSAGGGGEQGGTGGSAGGDGGGGSGGCLDVWTDGLTEPDESGPDTQIHGTSTFDGTHVWMAWSRPDAMSQFDVWLAAFACDGSVATAPLEVTQMDDNELDPVLSVSGDRLLVAWTSDNGTGNDNLDIRYRVFGLDGTPVTDALELSAVRNGVAVTGNARGPSITAVDDGWLLAGSWGHADAPAFQAFVVELDRDGVVQGASRDVELDPAFGQTSVAIATEGNAVHVAWQEDSTTSVSPAAWSSVLGAAASLLGEPGARPHVAAGPWYAWDTDGGDIVVQPPRGAARPLQASGTFVHSSRVSVVDGLATVMWLEQTSGIRNRIQLAPLGPDGAPLTTVALSTDQAPSVYPVDLTMIDATHAVVVYQDGDTPNFRLKAEWVTLTR